MFKIEFSTDNAVFDDDFDGEVKRILTAIGRQMSNVGDGDSAVIRDSNGNSIGRWEFKAS